MISTIYKEGQVVQSDKICLHQSEAGGSNPFLLAFLIAQKWFSLREWKRWINVGDWAFWLPQGLGDLLQQPPNPLERACSVRFESKRKHWTWERVDHAVKRIQREHFFRVVLTCCWLLRGQDDPHVLGHLVSDPPGPQSRAGYGEPWASVTSIQESKYLDPFWDRFSKGIHVCKYPESLTLV